VEPTISREELLVDGTDAAFRELVHGILAFGALHSEIRDGHARYIGITGPQYSVMTAIRHLESPTITRVAQHLSVTPTFVTAETNKLRTAGLVSKTRSTEDSRAVVLGLTSDGEALLDQLSDTQRQINDVEFDHLTRDEFTRLNATLATLIENSERAIELQRFLQRTPARPATVRQGRPARR